MIGRYIAIRPIPTEYCIRKTPPTRRQPPGIWIALPNPDIPTPTVKSQGSIPPKQLQSQIDILIQSIPIIRRLIISSWTDSEPESHFLQIKVGDACIIWRVIHDVPGKIHPLFLGTSLAFLALSFRPIDVLNA